MSFIDELQKRKDAGAIVMIPHPDGLPLTICNYTDRCTYEKLWDDVTLQCRGLVVDRGGNIVARPFRKFFNDTEHDEGEIPWHLPCEITEKVDGSLLIVFFYCGKWHVITRGSWTSSQAVEGGRILSDQIGFGSLSGGLTYLFEVVYPENRIVCDYGDRREVVLLGAVDTVSGEQYSASVFPKLNPVRTLPMSTDVRSLRSIITDDQEGYVVRFANGFRAKVKGDRYLELHRIMSGITARMVWERLSTGQLLDDVTAMVDEEIREWIDRKASQLRNEFRAIRSCAQNAVMSARAFETRKQQAEVICKHEPAVRSAAFAMLDDKSPDKIIWDKIYPDHERPSRIARAMVQ